MKTRKNYFRKMTAFILTLVMSCGMVTTAFASEATDVYEDERVSIVTQDINETDSIISYDFKDDDEEDFTLYIYGLGTENYYSETYDSEGNLLNRVIKEDDNKFVAYDTAGNIMAEAVRDENIESEIMPMYTWTTEPGPVSGTTFINDFAISTIVSILSGDLFDLIGGKLDPQFLWTVAINAVEAYTDRIFYFGFAQYGWDYGFSVVKVELDFYAFSNYTGFLGAYDHIIPNHG